MKAPVYFVSGIDTDAGKSYATGYLARQWNRLGIRTITQKLIQTGSSESPTGTVRSEDIELHRRIMGIPFTTDDAEGITFPEVFSYPASPHLAARIDGRSIDLERISAATGELSRRYDVVLLEGAGGLMVPLTDDLLTIDYIARHRYPVVFVTSGKLGSINHTLLSLEAIRQRDLRLHLVAYNLYPGADNPIIQEDTYTYLQTYLANHFPDTLFLKIPVIKL